MKMSGSLCTSGQNRTWLDTRQGLLRRPGMQQLPAQSIPPASYPVGAGEGIQMQRVGQKMSGANWLGCLHNVQYLSESGMKKALSLILFPRLGQDFPMIGVQQHQIFQSHCTPALQINAWLDAKNVADSQVPCRRQR